MKSLTTLAVAAALTLGVASASHAAVFAQFTPDHQAADYSWVQSGGSQQSGTFSSLGSYGCAGCAQTHFSYLDNTTSALAFIPSAFQINATVSPDAAASQNGAGVWTQTNVNGGFSFTYFDSHFAVGTHQTYGGLTLTNGVSNLLSGVFTGAWIQGAGGSGSTNIALGNGGHAAYASDVDQFQGKLPNTEEFSFNLLAVSPNFGASPGTSLNSFTANGGGNFSFLAAPEPATWGLMIVGFGGIGMMVRSRRRPALAKA